MEKLNAATERESWGHLIQTLPVGIVLVGADGTLREINQVALALLGLEKREDQINAVWGEICEFFDENREPLTPGQCPVRCVLSTGQPVKDRLLGYRRSPDSATTWIQINVIPVPHPTGTLEEVLISLGDVTRCQSTERRLRRMDRAYSEAERNARFGIWSRDLESDELFWSEETRKIFGFSSHDFLDYSGFMERVHPEDREWLSRAQKNLMEHGTRLDLEYRIIRRDGEIRHLHEKGVAHYDSRNQMDHLYGFVLDITERKNVNEALALSDQRFRLMFDLADAGIVFADPSGRVIESNAAFQEMLGYSAEELQGMSFRELTLEADLPKEETLLRQLLDGESDNYRIEKRYRRKSREIIWVDLVVSVVPREGKPGHLIAMVMDTSVRRKAEADRLEQERHRLQDQRMQSLGVMAAGIAHDFNNLFAAALGNLELSLMDLPARAAAGHGIQEAMIALRRAAALTHQLGVYAGDQRGAKRKVNLNEILRSGHAAWLKLMRDQVRLKLALDDDLRLIHVDLEQLDTVVQNLLRNSVESMPDSGGIIAIRTFARDFSATELRNNRADTSIEPGEYVVLEVADNGKGMRAEVLACIFEPFYSTHFLGRGLGLPEVMGVVRNHQGAILVESTLAQGTAIKVLFPAIPRAGISGEGSVEGAVPLQEAKSQLPESGRAILLVDDEPGIREACCALLSRMDFQVVCATNGDEAIVLFEALHTRIDCVIMDMVMPGKSGTAAFHEMQHIDSTVPIILISGYPESQVLEELAGKRPTSYLPKPFSMEGMKATIESVLPAR